MTQEEIKLQAVKLAIDISKEQSNTYNMDVIIYDANRILDFVIE